MRDFFQSSFTRSKLEKLFVSTALGKFAGYVSGSLVTVICTYHSAERRAIKNLFGLLPRKTRAGRTDPRNPEHDDAVATARVLAI